MKEKARRKSIVMSFVSGMLWPLTWWTLPPAFAVLVLLSACTTSAWLVEEEPVPNEETETLISEHRFFHVPEPALPLSSIFTAELLDERELQYDRHLVSRRYIKKYRPRYGYLAFGLAGMGVGLYLTNTSAIEASGLSARERLLMNLASAGIGTVSLINMKPVGEPGAAGELRLLTKVDDITRVDTVAAVIPGNARARANIVRGRDTLLYQQEFNFEENRIHIHLPAETGLTVLAADDTTGLDITLLYGEQTLHHHLPVSLFMSQFVEVTQSNVPVRSSPANLAGNIRQHVGANSLFPLLSVRGDNWYRILFRDQAAYLPASQSRVVWQATGQDEFDDLVVRPEEPVFGDLIIERNLPDRRRSNPDGIALIISNGSYRDPLRPLPHAGRTAELAALYASNVLGYYSDNIRVYQDMTAGEMRLLLGQSDSLFIGDRYLTPDESDIFFYYYGHAFCDDQQRMQLLPVDYDPGAVEEELVAFSELAEVMGNLRARQIVMVMDTDMTRASVYGQTTGPVIRARPEPWSEPRELLSHRKQDIALFWAASMGQTAGAYRAAAERTGYPYDIFTWYFFRSLQQETRTADDMREQLQRNVPFTSRRFHERAQDPGFFGNPELPLVPEAES